MTTLTERFLRYVAFDTQSAEDTGTTPSTAKQMLLARHLADELRRLGMQDVRLDRLGYVYATLPATTAKAVPVIGFIAHIDTSPDCSGADIRPRVVRHYDGGDITLSPGIVTSPQQFPELAAHVGEDLIVTDGRTLLGADDKAGVAEIVTACEHLLAHPEIEHGTIRVAFNPDEEIGLGAQHFDVDGFGCQFAYTMDGGEVGELEYENFNAAQARVTIHGRSVHPGYAKGKMVNAARIAAERLGLLPATEIPEQTEGYEGFFHLTALSGNCEQATLSLIIRDHDSDRFEARKQLMQSVVRIINDRYGPDTATLDCHDQYYNMRQCVEPVMHVVDIAREAMEQAGITPRVQAIRGGTDGAQLSFRHLPCPNIFAGGLNFHGPHEFCPIQSMEKAVQTILNICTITAQRPW